MVQPPLAEPCFFTIALKKILYLTHIKVALTGSAHGPAMFQRFLPPFLSILLMLALVAGSVSRGLAQAGMMVGDQGFSQLVICSGDGEATVTIDASGNPVAPAKGDMALECSKCLTATLAAALPPADELPLPGAVARLGLPPRGDLRPVPREIRPTIRGPPFHRFDA